MKDRVESNYEKMGEVLGSRDLPADLEEVGDAGMLHCVYSDC